MSTQSTAQMQDEQLADLVLKGIQTEFAAMLQVRLQTYATEIAKELAEAASKKVTARMVSYQKDYATMRTNVVVKFGEEK